MLGTGCVIVVMFIVVVLLIIQSRYQFKGGVRMNYQSSFRGLTVINFLKSSGVRRTMTPRIGYIVGVEESDTYLVRYIRTTAIESLGETTIDISDITDYENIEEPHRADPNYEIFIEILRPYRFMIDSRIGFIEPIDRRYYTATRGDIPTAIDLFKKEHPRTWTNRDLSDRLFHPERIYDLFNRLNSEQYSTHTHAYNRLLFPYFIYLCSLPYSYEDKKIPELDRLYPKGNLEIEENRKNIHNIIYESGRRVSIFYDTFIHTTMRLFGTSPVIFIYIINKDTSEANIIVTFRGTKTNFFDIVGDLISDLSVNLVPFPQLRDGSYPPDCYAPSGFAGVANQCYDQYLRVLEQRVQGLFDRFTVKNIVCTGHSLGGSVSTLLCPYLKMVWRPPAHDARIHNITVSAAPNMNGGLKEFMYRQGYLHTAIRIYNGSDVVPNVPTGTREYEGRYRRYNSPKFRPEWYRQLGQKNVGRGERMRDAAAAASSAAYTGMGAVYNDPRGAMSAATAAAAGWMPSWNWGADAAPDGAAAPDGSADVAPAADGSFEILSRHSSGADEAADIAAHTRDMRVVHIVTEQDYGAGVPTLIPNLYAFDVEPTTFSAVPFWKYYNFWGGAYPPHKYYKAHNDLQLYPM